MIRPLNVKNYGSVPHLSISKLGSGDHHIEAGKERILTKKARNKNDTIWVFEKYDGSNVGVCKSNGVVVPLSRNGYPASKSPHAQYRIFAKWVMQRYGIFNKMLEEGERIVGEWMYKRISLDYLIKGDPIVFFDYFDANNKRLSMISLIGNCVMFNLNYPRLLHVGGPVEVDEVKQYLKRSHMHNIRTMNPEGLVYRVENKEKFDFMAKWVRSDFIPGEYLKLNVKNEIIRI